jgi:uncharacterized membrane protein
MNPFDIKTVLLAKHAQHVVLIHFPIALFLVGAACDFVAHRTGNLAARAAARLNLVLAGIFTVPVLVTGVIAWQLALGGSRLKGILLLHLVLACVCSILMGMVARLHFKAMRFPDTPIPAYRLPLEALVTLLIGLTAHLGGFLSGVNGAM